MIALRAAAVDDNSPGTSEFVSIPQPVGVRDGDLILAAIVVETAGVQIDPPDDSWTEIIRTDPSRTLGIAVFWKTALNEQDRWVFRLSADVDCEGAALIYSGADGAGPIEAYAAALSAAGVVHDVAAAAAAEGGEEIAVFLGAAAAGTYTPAGGLAEIVAKTNGGTISAQARPAPAAGPIAAFTEAFSAASLGCSVAVVLAPSYGTVALEDAHALFLQGFPDGVEEVYDLEPTGDYFKLFRVIAQQLKTFAFDLADVLRRELVVRTSRYVLPDWERRFGLTTSRAATIGTIPQRQAQVVSAWRAAAGQGSSIPAVEGVLGPLLGYSPSTSVEVLECSRSALTVEHTYADLTPLVIADTATGTRSQSITHHGGIVSTGGVRLELELSSGSGAIDVTLTGPRGDSKTWSIDASGTELTLLFGQEFVGKQIYGIWDLSVTNNSGASITLIWSVLVEGVQVGIQPRQNTAAAIFHWGVYADPLHLGENGVPADFQAARAAIQKMAFAHTVANLIQSKVPFPDVEAGANSSIPDECTPV